MDTRHALKTGAAFNIGNVGGEALEARQILFDRRSGC